MARALTTTGGRPLTAPTAPPTDNRDFLQKASDFITSNNLPGAQLGQAIGNSAQSIWQAISQRSVQPLLQAGAENNANFGRVVGDVTRSAALPASLALAAPASLPVAALQYGGLAAAQAGGDTLAQGGTAPQAAHDASVSALEGAAIGGVFNLLGKGINYAAQKIGPSALEFTSGVPKAAIERAAQNPATAKEGLKLPVSEIRARAETALQSLQKDLNSEYRNGLRTLAVNAVPETAQSIPSTVLDKTKPLLNDLGITVRTTKNGLLADFSKSAIVKSGEQTAVKEALNTINTWGDFTPDGLNRLAQRVGALRKFESDGVTRSSAIVGKLYNGVTTAIKDTYPELGNVRSNYAANRKVLDTISQVLNASKDKVGAQQSAVSKLDNIFKENRDLYVNAIRELSNRSGQDILSLLAGGEFQRLLPGYIRTLGGGGAVGVGATVVSPWALLLAPLFSPRGAGVIARNAQSVANTTAKLTRAAATQAIPQLNK